MKLGLIPKGNRLLVKQVQLEEKTESGIIIKRDNGLAEQADMNWGEVVAVGEACWDQWDTGAWAEVGDTIYFAKHAGKKIMDFLHNEEYVIMCDVDVLALIIKEENEDD